MESKRKSELLERLLSAPKTRDEKEERVLDSLEWSLADFVPDDLESIGEFRAGMLLQEPDHWPAYIEASKKDRWAWETLSGLVRIFRKRAQGRVRDVVLPPPLSKWVLDVASSSKRGPPPWEHRPKLQVYRHHTIAIAIERLHDVGRPYAPPSENTACHLVGERLGKNIDSIRDIWKKQREWIRSTKAASPHVFLIG